MTKEERMRLLLIDVRAFLRNNAMDGVYEKGRREGLLDAINAVLASPDEPPAEPAVVVPELVWNSCGPGNGGLWDCPDSIDCAGFCSPPWTFEKATQEHQRRHREWVAEEIKRRAENRT